MGWSFKDLSQNDKAVSSFLPLHKSSCQPVHLICCSSHVPGPSASSRQSYFISHDKGFICPTHIIREDSSERGEGRAMNTEREKGRRKGGRGTESKERREDKERGED